MLLCLPGTGRGWFDNTPTEKKWKPGQPPNTDQDSGEAFRSWQQGGSSGAAGQQVALGSASWPPQPP